MYRYLQIDKCPDKEDIIIYQSVVLLLKLCRPKGWKGCTKYFLSV